MIEIEAEGMERAEKLLAAFPKGAEKAFSNAINRALAHTRTQAFREVQKVYAVKRGAFQSETATKIRKASVGKLIGVIEFSGAKLPLYQFNATPKAPSKSGNVKAGLLKGNWVDFDHAFIARLSGGHTGIFERDGRERYPISEIMGLSAAQMLARDEVADRLEKEAKEKVFQRAEHEIDRILSGYGW